MIPATPRPPGGPRTGARLPRRSPAGRAAAGLALALAALALAPAARADKVLLKDGRQIEGKILKADDDKVVRLKIGEFEIPIRGDLVDKTFVEDLEGYVPKNKQEEDYLKKGWVLFEGGWMSRQRREQVLAKRAAEDKAAIDEALKRQDWRNAISEETRHFVVRSNCTDEVRKEYEDRLEAYYKYFTDEWGVKLSPGQVRGKMQFMLYRDYGDFLSVTGMPYGVAGFFNFVTKELQLYNDQEDPDTSRDTLFHEGNHLLTYLIEPSFRYPIWINEGMAEYFGTARIDDKGKFHVGGLQYGRIVSLRTDEAAGQFMKLRDVLMTEQPGFKARHYAVAWSFVHFMMESPEYGKTFKGFFANLSKNQDLDIEKAYFNDGSTLNVPTLESTARAVEKRFGKSIEQLEAEWLQWIKQAYGELDAPAYYLAARLALRYPQEDGSHVKAAFEYYQKAVDLGITNARCYRDYCELLRKGGVLEARDQTVVREPDQALAWEMIQKAIELDPIDPVNYCEAAGVMVMDGKLQDLDKGLEYAKLAKTIAGPRNYGVKALTDELLALIEPAKERARERAEREAELAKLDRRQWHVAFYYVQGTEPPPNIEDLTTEDVRELIKAGKVGAEDFVFQAWREANQETGELLEPQEPWDKGWVKVKDCPVFAGDLPASGPAKGG